MVDWSQNELMIRSDAYVYTARHVFQSIVTAHAQIIIIIITVSRRR